MGNDAAIFDVVSLTHPLNVLTIYTHCCLAIRFNDVLPIYIINIYNLNGRDIVETDRTGLT